MLLRTVVWSLKYRLEINFIYETVIWNIVLCGVALSESRLG